MSLKILHVSEAFGGGIVSSLYSFANNSPEFEHHLLVCERKDQPLSKDLAAVFSSITPMKRSVVAAILDIRREVSRLNPHFIHLHSSYAGVFGRLAGLDPKRVIYSPHGFPFERRSAPIAIRGLYYAIEKILSRRALNFAGVSLDEVQRARRINKNVRAVFVPNTSDITRKGRTRAPSHSQLIKIACAGRLCPQKDPAFLIETISTLSSEIRDGLSITWIGSGDVNLAKRLSGLGVRVTGWITHEEAAQELEACDLYFHVAAWEGFPMTVIEAAALKRPILLRKIRAFNGFDLPNESLVQDPSDAARRLERWVRDADARLGSQLLSEKVGEITSPDRQCAALNELYRVHTV